MSRAAAPRRSGLRLPSFGIGPQIVAGILVLGLVGAMAIEPTRQLLQQRERIAGADGELRDLRRSNRRLQARIDRLQDPDYLEQEARQQIGLVRPGETAYLVMPPKRRPGRSERAKAPVQPVIEEPGFFEGFLAFVGIL